MEYEYLKNLNYEDFLSPNRILCYGGGTLAQAQIPRMVKSGLDIVGLIDKKKTGSILIAHHKYIFYTIEEALEVFGKDIVVLITVANENAITEIKEELIEKGYEPQRVHSYDVFNWLVKPSDKYYCSRIFNEIHYHADGLRACCVTTTDMLSFRFEGFGGNDDFYTHTERTIEKLKWYYECAKRGKIPLHCYGCSYLRDDAIADDLQYTVLDFASHSICNIDCVYCEYGKSVFKTSDIAFYSPNEDVENFI